MLDHKDGWNPEAFRGRYSEVLDRYDYIIGDWGYSQLRLKGFYRDNHPKVNRDTAISGMVDYINEYCNFGCAYFVLHKLKEAPQEGTFKDILIKEVPEPGSEDELDQEASEQAENVSHRESPSRGAGPAGNRDKDTAGGQSREHAAKDRPVREHQSRNHRNKEGQGKKNHKEFQGKGPQGSQGQQGGNGNQANPNSHKQNKENHPNRQNKQDNQSSQTNQGNPNNQNNQG